MEGHIMPTPDASDPVSYTCTCGQPDGQVLLFYRYFANSPALPSSLVPVAPAAAQDLAAFHTEQTTRLGLTGKIRVATEGFNVTVAGSRAGIAAYMRACLAHWSFAGLASTLESAAAQRAYFKPSGGCACVFPRGATVRVCDEITPLGVSGYTPRDWDVVQELTPAEWHARLIEVAAEDGAGASTDGHLELWDLRNHYESRIGYFVLGAQGQPANRPAIRRFSQWPRYVKAKTGQIGSGAAAGKEEKKQKQLLTYCTGGIRCEKATRWMAEREGEDRKICTLRGGIAAYLDWIDDEIGAGRMGAEESLFRGKNYVFDARGAVSSQSAAGGPVSQCHVCGTRDDRLSKCRSLGCHLVLIVCEGCELGSEPRCCRSCGDMDAKSRTMCACERAREQSLWAVARLNSRIET